MTAALRAPPAAFPGRRVRAAGCTKPDAPDTKHSLGRYASTSKANACHADLHGGEHVPKSVSVPSNGADRRHTVSQSSRKPPES